MKTTEVSTAAIVQTGCNYSHDPPFHPVHIYPEYPFGTLTSPGSNPSYRGVREALRFLGLDSEHYGGKQWNPLGNLVFPGDTVLLKPNFIRESHVLRPGEWKQVITHGSIIRAVLDYVFIALKGQGKVIVADGPQTDSDFDAICRETGVHDVVEFYSRHGLDVELLDLRRDRWFQKGDVIYKRISLPGDPAGYATVDLGDASEFATYRLNGQFYGADYNMEETRRFHSNGHHTYVLCRSVLDADVIINLPKMKTHKKTGVTLSLKNMVGINGYRNCLPHHTIGTPKEGGDEFPSASVTYKLQSRATVLFKEMLTRLGGKGGRWARVVKKVGRLAFGDTNQVIRSGNWYGNDTAWRMVLDLNKALFYFNGEGEWRRKPLRYFTIVDGIIAGEGNGPMAPEPVPAGLVVAGFNPVAVDTVCTTLMGFDYRKIPVVAKAWQIQDLPLVEFEPTHLRCVSNVPEWNGTLMDLEQSSHFGFEAHFGWQGYIERTVGENRRKKVCPDDL